uniref:Phospholipid/glycerol acyltransferase domain-containing protein n=1 Tax=Hucho hucho TaxID=62062 RepID=A0A4W5LEU1_9TELE
MDILEERRRSSDLGHAFRTFTPSPYRGAPPLSAGALNRTVLESQYLRYVTKEVAMETGESVDLVREEASGILEEMSQNLQLGFIRLLGFTLSKVFKRLFSHININQDGLNRLQQAIQESPVILMPNHRSYVDFLVLSYILFTYDLPIPVIAAGIPLMDMKMVGEILRRSGAFFIRRAIGSDKLYWAVLSEYVKTIVRVRVHTINVLYYHTVHYCMYTEYTKHQEYVESHPPFCPQNSLNSSGSWTLQGVESVPQGCWPHVDSNASPQLCQVGWMSFGWWTILDTHTETVECEKPSSVAVLDTNRCAWHLLPYPRSKALQSFVLLVHPLNGTTYTIHCLNCLKV